MVTINTYGTMGELSINNMTGKYRISKNEMVIDKHIVTIECIIFQ